MGNLINRDGWLGQSQLRYVEECLWWGGMISRREIMEKFSCSGQHASAVLQAYKEENPRAMSYDLSVKRYLAHPKMKYVYEAPRFEKELEKEEDLVGGIALPIKRVDDTVYRYLMVAIRQQRAVTVQYQSRSKREAERRVIMPHAFGFDGLRYHVRAWCPKHKEYRDFSLLRVQSISWPEEPAGELPVDEEWQEIVEVKVYVNPELSDGAQQALIEDYELCSREEPIVIKCRRAMEHYVLFRMGLDIHGSFADKVFFTRSADPKRG